jgi:hypothetical protein
MRSTIRSIIPPFTYQVLASWNPRDRCDVGAFAATFNEYIPVLTILLSLLAAAIGAGLGHFLTALRNRRDELAEFRLRAYSDFITSVSHLVSARRLGRIADETDELAKLNDAKIRICICAEKTVVDALNDFWQNGGTLEQEQEIVAFTVLCLRIRESLGNRRHDVSSAHMSDTIFKLQPSTYSYANAHDNESVQGGAAPRVE